MNVLILSCGRRVELVKYFKNAFLELGVDGKVICADMQRNAPALFVGDGFELLPHVTSADYKEQFVQLVRAYDIHLIIPTIDTELMFLSKNKAELESITNTTILVSDERVIDICSDKFKTARFFKEHGFLSPEILNEIQMNQVEFPVFIKPLNGSSSINAFKINNQKELEFFREYIEEPIIQRFIEGDEYTIDVCLNFDGTPVSIVPRLRIATRGGEILKGRIEKNQTLINEVKKVLEKLKAIGHITIQCIVNKQGIYFLEINPRYGGGAPMSIKAGANSPKYIIEMLQKAIRLDYTEEYKEKITGLRFDQAIYIDEQGLMIDD